MLQEVTLMVAACASTCATWLRLFTMVARAAGFVPARPKSEMSAQASGLTKSGPKRSKTPAKAAGKGQNPLNLGVQNDNISALVVRA